MLLSEVIDHPAIRRIDISSIKEKFTPNLNHLIHVITSFGYKIRIVGGAVRDILLGETPRDIDLLTDALPDEVIFILEKYNFDYITKGIKHGTIRVNFSDEENYEITSISYKIDDECCPHHLTVHSGRSWKDDAERRDFTIDAMSIDLDGHLYDYVGGHHDLRNHTVKFIKDPEKQITKDPIVLMRFFRMLSLFHNPKFDKSILPIIRQHRDLIKKIKPKRLSLEIDNIKSHQNGEKVLKMMSNLGLVL